MKKRILSIALSIVMLIGLLPITAGAVETHTHCVCGSTECSGDGHADTTSWTAWNNTDYLPGTDGASRSYYLTEDVTLGADWKPIAKWINLCLNGHQINLNGHIIAAMESGKSITITDCNSTNKTYTFKTTGQTDLENSGLWVLNPGATGDTEHTVTGGIITGGTGFAPTNGDTRLGGAVYILNNGTFNLYGGTLVGNRARDAGGAVYIHGGKFYMYGGAILGNVSEGDGTAFGAGGGGVFITNSCEFNMSGGTISENVSYNGSGGGVMNEGTFNISGSPVITGNKKATSDNNVYLPTDKKINVTGALTEDSQIGVEVNAANGVGVFTSGWDTHNSTVTKENFGKYFTSDRNELVVVKSGNELKLAEPPVLATGVTLNKTETTIGTGNTETLTATVEPNNATDKSVTWGSSNEDIATVDQNGKVTAVAKGSATITATAADGSGKSASCTVTVLETLTGTIAITYDEPQVGQNFNVESIVVPLTNCSLVDRSISPTSDIDAGGNYTVSVTIEPDSGYCFDSWHTVATFNGTPATVTVNNNGTVTFSRSYTFGGSVANSIAIYEGEDEVTTLKSIPLPGIGAANETAAFTAKVKDQYGQVMNNQAVSWSIVDANSQTGDKVTVANGVVTVKDGAAVGDYTLTATCGGKTDSITIRVAKAAPVATTVTVTGPQSIIIPETGSTTVEGYSVKVLDQYGEEIQFNNYAYGFYLGNEATATSTVTHVPADGTVTVTNEATPGECTFKVTYTYQDAFDADVNIYGEMTIALESLQAQTITCADVTGTYGQAEEITLNPSGKQTSGAYTFAIKDGAATNVVTVNGEGKLTILNAGQTTIVVTAPGDSTYASATVEVPVTIAPAASEVTSEPTAIGGLVYSNEAKTLVNIGTASGGTMRYSLNGVNWDSNPPTGINAGEYTVYYKVAGDSNHSDSQVGSVTVTIAKAVMTGIAADDYSGTYDGAEHGIVVKNIPDGATVTYSIDGANYTHDNKFTAATNGAQTVYYKVSNENYNDFTGSAKVSIAKVTPEVTTWPTVTGIVYVNGTATLNSNGVVENSIAGTFELAQTSWTTSGEKTVTVTFKPADSTNYNNAVNANYTVTVVKRQAASVAAQSAITDKLYGTAQSELGLPMTVSITTADGKNFADIPVSWSGYNANTLDEQTLTGTLDLTAIEAEVEQPVTAITASVVVDLQERTPGAYDYQPKAETYTGSPISHEIPDLDGVASISYSYVGTGETEYAASPDAPTNAGTYQVTATFTMEDGYGAVAPKTATLTINKAEVAEPVLSGTYTYNGENQTATLTGVEACMTVTGNTQSNAGTHTITVTLDNNHVWADGSDGSVSWTIAPAAVTVTAKNQSVYVGQSAPDLSSPVKDTHYTVTGLFGEDTIDLSGIVMGYRETPDTSAAGTFEITISGAVGGTNYEVAYTAGALTVSTRPVAPSPSAPSTYKVEDKTPENSDGSINLSKGNAKNGEKVTITVTPDEYYRTEKVIVKDKNGIEIEVTANEDGTFSFKMPASKVTVEPVFSWDNPFTDVSEDAYYTPAVEWALKNDITNGTGDGTTFSPADSCTRAQMATFLWRAAGSPDPAGSSNPFADVSEDAYYAKAVQWAYEQGITDGTSDTTFSPDAACTRAQMVTFLHRVADTQKPEGNTNPFTDVPDAYYTEAVQWAYEQSITSGTSATTFSPDAICARGQMVTFLYRFFVK